MAHANRQGIYRPLPQQSLSDSDSDKELQMDSLYTYPPSSTLQNGVFGSKHDECEWEVRSFKPHNPKSNNWPLYKHILFYSSIGLCVLTTCVFLYVLPCHDTCPVRIKEWDRSLDDLELIGDINVVKNNLVIVYKRAVNVNSSERSNGAVSLVGRNGEVAWKFKEAEEPLSLNCYSIDTKTSNVCLLATKRKLSLIDPADGSLIWYSQPLALTDKPVIIADLNGDNVNDILAITNENEAALVSGKNGALLSTFSLKHCRNVTSETFVDNDYLYSCYQDKLPNKRYYKIPEATLVKLLTNKRVELDKFAVSYQRRADELLLGKRKLGVANKGTCPNCSAQIQLEDEETGALIHTWTYGNGYVMKPVSFAFKATKENVRLFRGHVNGFVIKLWQWAPDSRRIKRNSTLRVVKEEVILLTFNDTDFHIINASSYEVNQLCVVGGNGEDAQECQPSLQNQKESLLITSLYDDDMLELTSFRSSYDLAKWRLVSTIRLIRLEAELPKLYKTSK